MQHLAAVEDGAVFKMQIQAAVIKVHRADCGGAVIDKPRFSVQKSGRVAVNFHPGVEQIREIAARKLVDRLFVRHAGGVDAHIHAALGSQP